MDKVPMYVRFIKLNSEDNKYKMRAEFYNSEKEHIISVRFGAAGYSDYTIHRDEARKERYLLRHAPRENWGQPMSRGTLSRFILWNKPTLEASIENYRERFNLGRY